jgi:hypothetical protein
LPSLAVYYSVSLCQTLLDYIQGLPLDERAVTAIETSLLPDAIKLLNLAQGTEMGFGSCLFFVCCVYFVMCCVHFVVVIVAVFVLV